MERPVYSWPWPRMRRLKETPEPPLLGRKDLDGVRDLCVGARLHFGQVCFVRGVDKNGERSETVGRRARDAEFEGACLDEPLRRDTTLGDGDEGGRVLLQQWSVMPSRQIDRYHVHGAS